MSPVSTSHSKVLADKLGIVADLLARAVEHRLALDQDHRAVGERGYRGVVFVHDHGGDAAAFGRLGLAARIPGS